MFIVLKKPLITVEGRDTPYTNTKNYCEDIREPISMVVDRNVEDEEK